MNELEKIWIECILNIAIDANIHFNRSNYVGFSDTEKNNELGKGIEKLNNVIELLTKALI
jgi:hypothetical protein